MKFLRFVECFILVLFLLADVCLFLLGLCQRQLVNQMFYVKQDIVQLNPINQLLFSISSLRKQFFEKQQRDIHSIWGVRAAELMSLKRDKTIFITW